VTLPQDTRGPSQSLAILKEAATARPPLGPGRGFKDGDLPDIVLVQKAARRVLLFLVICAVALADFDEAAFFRAAVILVPDVNEAAVNGADFKNLHGPHPSIFVSQHDRQDAHRLGKIGGVFATFREYRLSQGELRRAYSRTHFLSDSWASISKRRRGFRDLFAGATRCGEAADSAAHITAYPSNNGGLLAVPSTTHARLG